MDDLARCVDTFNMDKLSMAYFLGQCGHESGGLRYPVEIFDGSNYEGRTDLGNSQPGDGVKFAGTGWIQVTGRYNHQSFSDYMASIGQADPKIMEIGKTYTSEKYPWTISGNWWRCAGMNAFCSNRPQHTNGQIDEVGARVNGRMPPNGAADRLEYTHRAFDLLGFDVMDDVSHALEIEITKRRIERSNSLEELRHLSLRCIDLMKHQRQVLQQLIEQAIDEGLM